MTRDEAIAFTKSFLSDDQFKQAKKCKSAREICVTIIVPNIDQINSMPVHQIDDPMMLSYLVEFAIMIENRERK